MRLISVTLISAVVCSGCSSLPRRTRSVYFMTGGAAVGAVSGAALSPNESSRMLNALVFGLAGGVAGALLSIATEQAPGERVETPSLKQKELGADFRSREFQLPVDSSLPAFVKERLQPAVIEELVETDMISDDGTLHEPHKIYRIKRNAELYPKGKRDEQAAKEVRK